MCDLERECYGQSTCQLGRDLLEWNEVILKHMLTLRDQKQELDFIIKKQQDELYKLRNELDEKKTQMDHLNLVNSEASHSIELYNKVIKMLEDGYGNLVDSSEGVAQLVSQEVSELEQIMDKKTSTSESKTKVCECPDDKEIKKKKKGSCCTKVECPGRTS